MGVSGCGKSTIGVRLARKLDRDFLEGDTFHPAANVEKMSRGVPLDDDDRRPWLMAIADAIDAARKSRRGSSSPARLSSDPTERSSPPDMTTLPSCFSRAART